MLQVYPLEAQLVFDFQRIVFEVTTERAIAACKREEGARTVRRHSLVSLCITYLQL